MLRRCVLALIVVAIPAFAFAADATPATAPWLYNQLAARAAENATTAAQAGHDSEADTWRAWAAFYRREAALPEIRTMTAVELTTNAAHNNRLSLAHWERKGDRRRAAFFRASRGFWLTIARQLIGGRHDVKVRFPHAMMLTPLPGLAGTPWEHSAKSGH